MRTPCLLQLNNSGAPNDMPTLEIGAFDPTTDTILIEGTRYSGSLFREFGVDAMIGQVLRIDRHENGAVTVTKLRDMNQQQTCGLRGKDRAGWLADKICNGGDYAKEAAFVLEQQADEIERLREFAMEVRRTGDTRLASMAVAVMARNAPDVSGGRACEPSA